MKFSTPDGAPALPEVTRKIEKLAEKHLRVADKKPSRRPAPPAENIDPVPDYLKTLAQKVAVGELKKSLEQGMERDAFREELRRKLEEMAELMRQMSVCAR